MNPYIYNSFKNEWNQYPLNTDLNLPYEEWNKYMVKKILFVLMSDLQQYI
jgi:hypothetical protein